MSEPNFYNPDGTLNEEAFQNAVTKARQQIALEYPTLGKAQANAKIQYLPKGKYGGGLEYYPAHEQENPNPGVVTQEVYDKLLKQPQEGQSSLKNALAADMLHYVGGYDADGNANDPTYMGMQKAFEKAYTPRDQASNERAWAKTQQDGAWNGSKEDWFTASRTPAYIRGALFNQWQNDDGTPYQGDTPEQQQILNSLRGYITGRGQASPVTGGQ